ncbi:MAG TPA: glycosyltransferase family A protein [Rhizomicrobium sp.]
MREMLRRFFRSIGHERVSPEAPPGVRKQAPVAVISFNRPHYLSQVLESLAAQTALNGRHVVLFQDNAVSPYSCKRYGRDEDIAACIDIFRGRFPEGTVALAEHNLGIARNFLRAEEFVFNELEAEACYFFEDDMILSPHYLTMMDQIASFALTNDKVGYFTAHGRLGLSLERQRAMARRMTRMGLHWAFGLTRQHWLDLRRWLEPYYGFLEGTDYNAKPTRKIGSHYRSMGIPVLAMNQDVMKKAGSYALGHVSISTFACFGKYIGAQGVHHSAEYYDKTPYKHTVLYPEPVELIFPSADELATLRKTEMDIRWRRFRSRFAEAPAPELAESPTANVNAG